MSDVDLSQNAVEAAETTISSSLLLGHLKVFERRVEWLLARLQESGAERIPVYVTRDDLQLVFSLVVLLAKYDPYIFELEPTQDVPPETLLASNRKGLWDIHRVMNSEHELGGGDVASFVRARMFLNDHLDAAMHAWDRAQAGEPLEPGDQEFLHSLVDYYSSAEGLLSQFSESESPE